MPIASSIAKPTLRKNVDFALIGAGDNHEILAVGVRRYNLVEPSAKQMSFNHERRRRSLAMTGKERRLSPVR